VTTVLVFAVVLLVAVLVSELARRTILSTAVLFLVAGFVAGAGVSGAIRIHPRDPVVATLAELALFSVLFTDGMKAGISDLREAWHLPGRALLLGLPLTFLGTAALARYVAGLPWTESFLLGAILSPTDPVLAEAIVGREDVPFRLRHLLNVESGLNDGLALPVVLVLLEVAGSGHPHVARVLGELGLGVMIGAAVPAVAAVLLRKPALRAAGRYEPLAAFAIGVLVYALTRTVGANSFLAAFSGGSALASVEPRLRQEFSQFGELITELLKLAALLVFGALLSPRLLGDVGLGGYVFGVSALLLVRPAAIGLSMLGTGIRGREWVTVAWFGPKGFASVVYGLLMLDRNVPHAERLFHLVAIAVAVSILAHASTDVPLARLFHAEVDGPEDGPEPGRALGP
jgi:NhaP-type Na+/H+ or K+/H+ antiporter